ncbi:mannose-1-phosphate guanyltransferase [Blyttiomyces sp. JEL0837]|nr:mannose-1-phosphate guanyltransferase [Blyttiomyces sp. JEL0837]
MIVHQIEALVKCGVTDVVLAVNYRPEIMVKAMQKYETELNVKIHFSLENEPLGTAGPLALASSILAKDDSPFFVLNSDVICEFPFTEMLNFHKAHGGEGTILVTRVEDPSKYGVVVNRAGTTSIEKFVEKPKEFISNKINAGLYIFNPSILKRIEPRPMSIEKEVFPQMAAQGQIHAMDLPGFWMDVGQPKDFLTGTGLWLSSVAKKTPAALKTGPSFVGHRTVVMEGAAVKDHAWVQSAIIGWHSTVGRWARLENVTVLGDDVHVADEIYINGGSVLPHKSVSANVAEPSIIM